MPDVFPKTVRLKADAAVIGGGTAGVAAAWLLAERGFKTVLVEKAAIERSGCLAAGVNAINAWIAPGRSPADYAAYALADAHGIASMELLLTMSERLREAALFLERLGVPFHRGPDGAWASRSWRNVKINGGPIKPLLASLVRDRPEVTLLERAHALSLLVSPDPGSPGACRAAGVAALSLDSGGIVAVEAPFTVCATGGAAGIYRPNNPGHSGHKMWYPPFNTGGGWAMGLWAGAELTTLEMRFVALRLQDTAAPTGTLAVGQGASQVNSLGEAYESRYGNTTSQRVLAWRKETEAGRGPCVMRTGPLDAAGRRALVRSYLHMNPMQALRFLEEEAELADSGAEGVQRECAVQIEGTEPYIMGGHTAGGFQVDRFRETTLPGLYACGDAAGGAPQKYVTGAMAEGWMAAEAIAARLEGGPPSSTETFEASAPGTMPSAPGAGSPAPNAGLCPEDVLERLRERLARFLRGKAPVYSAESLEEAMQKAMDLYAGGRTAGYRYSRAGLSEAASRVHDVWRLSGSLAADSPRGISRIWELRERLAVARSLICHLTERTETRWPGFGEYAEYPDPDPAQEHFVNSRVSLPPVLPPEDLAMHPPVALTRSLDGRPLDRGDKEASRHKDGESRMEGGAPEIGAADQAVGCRSGKGGLACP